MPPCRQFSLASTIETSTSVYSPSAVVGRNRRDKTHAGLLFSACCVPPESYKLQEYLEVVRNTCPSYRALLAPGRFGYFAGFETKEGLPTALVKVDLEVRRKAYCTAAVFVATIPIVATANSVCTLFLHSMVHKSCSGSTLKNIIVYVGETLLE